MTCYIHMKYNRRQPKQYYKRQNKDDIILIERISILENSYYSLNNFFIFHFPLGSHCITLKCRRLLVFYLQVNYNSYGN